MRIPFHKPIIPDSFDDILTASIKKGWLTTGPAVKEFETILSELTNSKHSIVVNSCTAALHLALAAKNYGRGDKFIAPTYTFVASVEVGEYLGMEPILVDCDSDFNIDLDKIETIIKNDKNIKAIIPVHFAGKPVDMKNLFSITDKYGVFVLEDAAHALEAVSNIGKVGNTNDATAFSFYANKNITTLGEGGAVSTNNNKLAEKIRKLSLHGMSKDGWKRFKVGNKWQYDVSELGYKYNLTDVAASFGVWQINQLDKWYERRVSIYNTYQESFKDIEGIICPRNVNGKEKHSHHLYIIRLHPNSWKISRNKIIELLNEAGVGTSVHYKPVHMHSYYHKKYGYKPNDFPNAKLFSENVISLPFYPALDNKQLRYIINIIYKLWEKYKAR